MMRLIPIYTSRSWYCECEDSDGVPVHVDPEDTIPLPNPFFDLSDIRF